MGLRGYNAMSLVGTVARKRGHSYHLISSSMLKRSWLIEYAALVRTISVILTTKKDNSTILVAAVIKVLSDPQEDLWSINASPRKP
jgi:hypothetical protein